MQEITINDSFGKALAKLLWEDFSVRNGAAIFQL